MRTSECEWGPRYVIEPWATKRGSRHGVSSYKPISYRTSVTADLEQVSQVAFRVERIVIPVQIGQLFQINGIWINGRSQLAGVESVPAQIFSSMIDSYVQMDVIPAGKSIRMRVTYTGEEDDGMQFLAVLIGTVYSVKPDLPSVLEMDRRSTISITSRVMMGARRAQLTAVIKKRGRGWSACCEALGAIAEGRSYEGAKAHLASRIEEMVQRPFALRDDARAPSSFHVTITDDLAIESNDPIALAAHVARFQRFHHSGRDALIWPAPNAP